MDRRDLVLLLLLIISIKLDLCYGQPDIGAALPDKGSQTVNIGPGSKISIQFSQDSTLKQEETNQPEVANRKIVPPPIDMENVPPVMQQSFTNKTESEEFDLEKSISTIEMENVPPVMRQAFTNKTESDEFDLEKSISTIDMENVPPVMQQAFTNKTESEEFDLENIIPTIDHPNNKGKLMSLVIDNVNVTDKKALSGLINDIGTSVNRHFNGGEDHLHIPQTSGTENIDQEPVEGIDSFDVESKSNPDFPENRKTFSETVDYQEDQSNPAKDEELNAENFRLPKLSSENPEFNRENFESPQSNSVHSENMEPKTESNKTGKKLNRRQQIPVKKHYEDVPIDLSNVPPKMKDTFIQNRKIKGKKEDGVKSEEFDMPTGPLIHSSEQKVKEKKPYADPIAGIDGFPHNPSKIPPGNKYNIPNNIPLGHPDNIHNLSYDIPNLSGYKPNIGEKIPNFPNNTPPSYPDNIPNLPGNKPNPAGKIPDLFGNIPNNLSNIPNLLGKIQSHLRNNPNILRNIANHLGTIPNFLQKIPKHLRNNPNILNNIPNDLESIPYFLKKLPKYLRNNPNILGKIPDHLENIPNLLGNILNQGKTKSEMKTKSYGKKIKEKKHDPMTWKGDLPSNIPKLNQPLELETENLETLKSNEEIEIELENDNSGFPSPGASIVSPELQIDSYEDFKSNREIPENTDMKHKNPETFNLPAETINHNGDKYKVVENPDLHEEIVVSPELNEVDIENLNKNSIKKANFRYAKPYLSEINENPGLKDEEKPRKRTNGPIRNDNMPQSDMVRTGMEIFEGDMLAKKKNNSVIVGRDFESELIDLDDPKEPWNLTTEQNEEAAAAFKIANPEMHENIAENPHKNMNTELNGINEATPNKKKHGKELNEVNGVTPLENFNNEELNVENEDNSGRNINDDESNAVNIDTMENDFKKVQRPDSNELLLELTKGSKKKSERPGKGTRAIKSRGNGQRAPYVRGKNGKTKNTGRKMKILRPTRRMQKYRNKVGSPRIQNQRKYEMTRPLGKITRPNGNKRNRTNRDRIRRPTYSGRQNIRPKKKKVKHYPKPFRFGK